MRRYVIGLCAAPGATPTPAHRPQSPPPEQAMRPRRPNATIPGTRCRDTGRLMEVPMDNHAVDPAPSPGRAGDDRLAGEVARGGATAAQPTRPAITTTGFTLFE